MPPLHSMTPADARASMDAMVALMGPVEDVASVADRTIDAGGQTLPVRIYRPEGLGDGPAPTLVFYHGGGFVIGGLASHDRDCRASGEPRPVSGHRRRLPAGTRAPVPGGARRRHRRARVRRRQRRRARRRRRPPGGRWRLRRRQPVRRRRPPCPRCRHPAAVAAADLPGRRRQGGRFPISCRQRHRLHARRRLDPLVHRRLLPRRRTRRLAGAPMRAASHARRGPGARDHGGVRPVARRGRGVRRQAGVRRRAGQGDVATTG